MPVSPLMTMEAGNLFCGVAEPSGTSLTNSNHLRLTDIKLPGIDEQYVDHRAAGAPIAIEINTMFARLQCDFTLAGWTDQVAELVDSWAVTDNQFWVYGALRDRSSGAVYQAKASIFGRLSRSDPQLWRRGDVAHWAYSIRCITSYTLEVNGETPYYEWDYFENLWKVGGNDRLAEINAALQIPNTATVAG